MFSVDRTGKEHPVVGSDSMRFVPFHCEQIRSNSPGVCAFCVCRGTNKPLSGAGTSFHFSQAAQPPLCKPGRPSCCAQKTLGSWSTCHGGRLPAVVGTYLPPHLATFPHLGRGRRGSHVHFVNLSPAGWAGVGSSREESLG